MKTDRQIRLAATKREYRRVFDDMCLPAQNIVAECRDGTWIKKAYNGIGRFGWSKWKKEI